MQPQTTTIRLAISGVTGLYHHELLKLEAKHMEWMKTMVKCYITDVLLSSPEHIILVSGGVAWAEHVAIQLFREGGYAGLELYLPSEFNTKLHQYKNTHEGRRLNDLHKKCQDKIGQPIFEELTSVNSHKKGVKITIQRAWKPRNTLIARNCDHLITFTFDENCPTNDLASDIWTKVSHQNKVHFNLEMA